MLPAFDLDSADNISASSVYALDALAFLDRTALPVVPYVSNAFQLVGRRRSRTLKFLRIQFQIINDRIDRIRPRAMYHRLMSGSRQHIEPLPLFW